MAAPAKQAGTFIGKDIAAFNTGRSCPTFRYVDSGSMAVVHASAVANLHGFKFSRRLGLLLWAIVHLALDPQPKEPDQLEHRMAVRPSDPATGLDSAKWNAQPASGA